MTNDQKYIEFTKKYSFTGTNAQFLEFISAIKEQMISEGWRQCAKGQGETQFCAQVEQERAKMAMLEREALYAAECFYDVRNGRPRNIGEVESDLRAAISATKKYADAFIAEVQARALDEVANKWGGYGWGPRELRSMAAELRQSAAQPESGRMCSCIECVPDAEQPERKEGGK